MTSAFEQYQSGALDGKDANLSDPSENTPPQMIEVDLEDIETKAKTLVRESFNRTFFPGPETLKAKREDFYVVWKVKVLGHWKVLVSTDLISGQYWEVTYNGNKTEAYVDHYVKRSNEAVTDETYAAMS